MVEMKSGRLFMPLVVSLLILFIPQFCFAEVRSERAIQILRNSPKIIDSQQALRGFVKGEPEVHVIVNLEKPQGAQDIKSLEDLASRQRLKDVISVAQDKIINSLDLKEVSINKRFCYIPGFAACVTLKGLNQLIELPDVISIEPDRTLHAHLVQGIPLVNASTVRTVYNGQGVAIAICDTGIDYNHPKLGDGGFPNNKVIGGYDFGGSSNFPASEDDDPMDQHGHGTSCAGIAAGDSPGQGNYIGGVAKTARLYAIKISHGATGEAYGSDMIAGWEWCITHQYDDADHPILVISTSFGNGGYSDVCDSVSSSMTGAAGNAVSAGMTLFVSVVRTRSRSLGIYDTGRPGDALFKRGFFSGHFCALAQYLHDKTWRRLCKRFRGNVLCMPLYGWCCSLHAECCQSKHGFFFIASSSQVKSYCIR